MVRPILFGFPLYVPSKSYSWDSQSFLAKTLNTFLSDPKQIRKATSLFRENYMCIYVFVENDVR